ncbi:protease SohB [Aliiglaciecola sp. 2_MG-2023]|uniref:protease SohB n=1 Tax=unclassified Aliiglaciecola TaxID=2593648 RepID=UPI0026E34C07|nr:MULTISPECIES: protease SohB [unclassified Aliiglaciecola]MDO6712236.1 protease SohB [Aliiglaciecola sp. 2_MG-2023]MDO6753526.1 protease SohB [Aliiglaciecola sp. 1_MG-2023]
MEFLFQYGLFVAKAVTIVVAILLTVGGIVALASKQKQGNGQLEIKSVSEQFEELKEHAQHLLLSKEQLKKKQKEQKKADKVAKKKDESDQKPNLFVVDFKGSMDAHEVDSLREEITAILCAAQPKDEVLVRLESGGGVVHGYGLAASQLQRLKDKNIHLTAAVDKVAASGGYMMACVADNVLSAKFAIIGSIGVIAQLPNFNKILKKNDIEFEQHTAGDFKRTLTLFGENTDQGRDKFKQELEEVHVMFKDFVSSHRSELDIDKVATGEYWYGSRAKELGLVDVIQTSDDFLMSKLESRNIYSVKYSKKKGLAEKLGKAASTGIESTFVKLWSKSQTLFK